MIFGCDFQSFGDLIWTWCAQDACLFKFLVRWEIMYFFFAFYFTYRIRFLVTLSLIDFTRFSFIFLNVFIQVFPYFLHSRSQLKKDFLFWSYFAFSDSRMLQHFSSLNPFYFIQVTHPIKQVHEVLWKCIRLLKRGLVLPKLAGIFDIKLEPLVIWWSLPPRRVPRF